MKTSMICYYRRESMTVPYAADEICMGLRMRRKSSPSRYSSYLSYKFPTSFAVDHYVSIISGSDNSPLAPKNMVQKLQTTVLSTHLAIIFFNQGRPIVRSATQVITA